MAKLLNVSSNESINDHITANLLQEIPVRVGVAVPLANVVVLVPLVAAATVPVGHDQTGLLVGDALVCLPHQVPEYPLLDL